MASKKRKRPPSYGTGVPARELTDAFGNLPPLPRVTENTLEQAYPRLTAHLKKQRSKKQ